MVKESIKLKEYHKNGTLSYLSEYDIIFPMFVDYYDNLIITVNCEYLLKRKIEKYFDNGQLSWRLIYDEKGFLINKYESSFRKDGTIINF